MQYSGKRLESDGDEVFLNQGESMRRLVLIAALILFAAKAAFAQSPYPSNMYESHVRAVSEVPLVSGTSSAAEGSHNILTTTGKLATLCASWHTQAARWLMVFDGPVPSNGATTSCAASSVSGCMAWCAPWTTATTPADEFTCADWTTHPIWAKFGIGVALSTSASGCASLTTEGANDWFNWQRE